MEKTTIYAGYAASSKLIPTPLENGVQELDTYMQKYNTSYPTLTLPEHDNARQDAYKNLKRRKMLAAITGEVKNGERRDSNVVNRTILPLDLDSISKSIVSRDSLSERLSELLGVKMYIYPSLGCNYHSKGLRYHVWLPLSRAVNKHEYQLLIDYYNQLLKEKNIITKIDNSNGTWSQLNGLPTMTQFTPEADRKALVLIVPGSLLDVDTVLKPAQEKAAQAIKPDEQVPKAAAETFLKDKKPVDVVTDFARRNGEWLNDYNNFLAAYFALKGAEKAGQISHDEALACVRALAGDDVSMAQANENKYRHDRSNYPKGRGLSWFVQSSQLREQQPEWVKFRQNGTPYTRGDYLGKAILKTHHVAYKPRVIGAGGAIWTGQRWDDSDAEAAIGKVADDMLSKADIWSDKTVSDTIKYIKRHNEAIDWSKNQFDSSNPLLVEFNNGTLNLEDLSFSQSEPTNYIPIHFDYDWNPQLANPAQFCPHWLNYLTELVGGDKQAFLTMTRAIGYMYERDYKHAIFIVLYGDGKNGKSKFTNRVKNLIIGSENTAAVSLSSLASKTDRFSSALLYHKALNLFNDIDQSFLQNTGTVKNLTGDDALTAEFKGRTGFSFNNSAFLLFSANGLPSFKDDSYGFERRPRVIDFRINFDKAKNELFDKKYPTDMLKQEAQAFRQYCITEYQKHMNEDTDDCFPESLQMKTERQTWLNLANSSKNFFDSMTRYDEGKRQVGQGESPVLLYKFYKGWCDINGQNPLSRPNFEQKLQKKYPRTAQNRVRIDNGTRVRRWCGVMLTEDAFDTITNFSDQSRFFAAIDERNLFGYHEWHLETASQQIF